LLKIVYLHEEFFSTIPPMKTFTLITILFIFSGCTQVVTAPVKLAGAVVSTTFDVAGAAGGAVVNTVTGGSSKED